jgi:hypothetical protein
VIVDLPKSLARLRMTRCLTVWLPAATIQK